MPAPRVLIVLGVLAAAVVLFVVLRPGADETAAPGGDEVATDATPPAAEPLEEEPEPAETDVPEEEPAAEEPEPPAPEPATLSIVLRAGVPEGGTQRLAVRQGDEVRIVVRSDTADELHLHGYDLVRPVGPGAPAQMRFTATVPGRFELETHERHLVVGEVEVQP